MPSIKKIPSWIPKSISPRSLLLDAKNPRLTPSSLPVSERQLIEVLVTHEKVLDLAKNIASYSFFPSEPLIAVREDRKYVVVEGNRRLAACKLLLDPGLAPTAFEKRFNAIAAMAGAQVPTEIPILVAPSREAAYPLIIARHTSTQIETWKPAMKAHFYYNLVESGLSPDEIADKFKVPLGEIQDELRGHNLYRMACRLDIPKADDVRDPRKFPLSTLMRVFDAPQGREFFGVKYSDDGKIEGSIPEAEFARGYSRLVSDIASGRQDSRTLATPEKIKDYLHSFAADEKPDTTKPGVFNSDSFLSTAVTRVKETPKRPVKRPAQPSCPGLIPKGFPCSSKNGRVQKLVEELKGLSPLRFSNACAFTFRCLLEVSAYVFLDSKGQIAAMRTEYEAAIKAKNFKRPPDKQAKIEPNWTPELNEMILRLANPAHGLLKNAQARKALPRVMKDEEHLFALNLSVHNSTYHPTEPKLRDAWANLEEYFREILA